jgi:hypothetical protein
MERRRDQKLEDGRDEDTETDQRSIGAVESVRGEKIFSFFSQS